MTIENEKRGCEAKTVFRFLQLLFSTRCEKKYIILFVFQWSLQISVIDYSVY